MEAKGSEDEAKDSKEEEPPSKVVIDLLNFAMRVVHEEMSGFFEQVRSRRPAVLRCLHAIDARRLQERLCRFWGRFDGSVRTGLQGRRALLDRSR